MVLRKGLGATPAILEGLSRAKPSHKRGQDMAIYLFGIWFWMSRLPLLVMAGLFCLQAAYMLAIVLIVYLESEKEQ